MKPMIIAIGIAASLATASGATSAAGESRSQPRAAQKFSVGDALTPSQRGELARQFVLKWGAYVQQAHGLDVRTWSTRMVGTFATADATNFRRALQRATYEGAMSTLDGMGHRLSDAQVIDTLAKSKAGAADPYALGDTTRDLVFTALQPCRILDTRGTGAGALPGNSSRVFSAWGLTSFAAQGGSTTDCGLSAQSPEAIVVNLTAVTPAQTGYAKMFPASGPSPLTATIIYEAGKTISNGALVKLGAWGQYDFAIFSERTADYVVDIVGYYDAPYATELQCVNTALAESTISAGTSNWFVNPACPVGYKATTPYCWTSASGVYSKGSGFVSNDASGATFCAWQNTVATAQITLGGNVCCRVPGR